MTAKGSIRSPLEPRCAGQPFVPSVALAGSLAKYYDPADEAPYFLAVGGAAVTFGVLLAIASPPIRRLMKGVR